MHTRRSILQKSLVTLGAISLSSLLLGCGRKNADIDLLPPDENGLMLPAGFSSRIIARSGVSPYVGSPYLWHNRPDGGATFPTSSGGWIYVSNSEVPNGFGGVGAIQFDAGGSILQAYSILDNTNNNCAGGATYWGTWLSCEEVENGNVWECDPYGQFMPIIRPALGIFAHEAITIDISTNFLYMTEDRLDGCFYRFVPDSFNSQGYPDLSSGTLEVAVVDSSTLLVNWLPVPDPSASIVPTRNQVASSTVFNGGEGIVFYGGIVSFATKGDNRIWAYDTVTGRISIVYDASTHPNPILMGLDNITIFNRGELVVAEDGGDFQIVAITNTNKLIPLVQIVGHHPDSEVTGPAFTQDGVRLYFSSQLGKTGTVNGGVTFEVVGPFHNVLS